MLDSEQCCKQSELDVWRGRLVQVAQHWRTTPYHPLPSRGVRDSKFLSSVCFSLSGIFVLGIWCAKKWLCKLGMRVWSLISCYREESSDRVGKGRGMKRSLERSCGLVQSTGCLQGHCVPPSPAQHAAGFC